MRLFEPAVEAELIDRPNRFLIRARRDGRVLHAHCANPGSMLELLVPGRRVILERASGSRATRYTLAAVYNRGLVVPLVAARANDAAAALVLPDLYPRALEIRREVVEAGSRFDFLIRLPHRELLLEVKACTLVSHGVALFPDAPTTRGARHVRELAARARAGGGPGAILFLVMQQPAGFFAPNTHTDPAFARTLIEASAVLEIHAAGVSTGADGIARLETARLPVRLDEIRPALESGGGVYLLIVRLDRDLRIDPGALGPVSLARGHYVYVGSALRGLDSRLTRHRRRRKKLRWHIDWLTAAADRVLPLPIRTVHPLECRLARAVADITPAAVPGFGSSDCRCASHLFTFAGDPLRDPRFVDLLLAFRHAHASGDSERA